jgi:hypothetical protein
MIKSISTLIALGILLLLQGCSSSQLIDHWRNPEIVYFDAQKVLVLAMSNDAINRRRFENRLVEQLEKKGVHAVNSENLFDYHYTTRPRTEEELTSLRQEILNQGFDAILVSKITGAEDKVTLLQSYKDLDRLFNDFYDDYNFSQSVFSTEEEVQSYQVYHAESALYCVCPSKEKQMIWKGSFVVTRPDRERKAINDYIKLLVHALDDQHLLINTTVQ